MLPKGILFDLDNTLIDFMTMKRRCTEAAITAMIDAGLEMSRSKAFSLMFGMYTKYGLEDHTIYQKFLPLVLHSEVHLAFYYKRQ